MGEKYHIVCIAYRKNHTQKRDITAFSEAEARKSNVFFLYGHTGSTILPYDAKPEWVSKAYNILND